MSDMAQGWRGRVKSRHFVSALYDHYKELSFVARLSPSAELDSDTMTVLRLFSPARLQRVAEAIDVDANGFITVAAVNRFTDARPPSWR